jgi:LPXTG-motif cell wall-anchored protein
MSRRSRVRARLLIALITASVGLLAAPRAAHAHTDFDFSVPTDGAAVGELVSEITVAFTDAVTLVGPGFEVLDPQGRVLQPFAVTDDDAVFRLQLDPPLGGGLVAVKYEVAAADGHVLTGNFTFTVTTDAPVVTDPPATAPPTAPAATEPVATEPIATEPVATEPAVAATTAAPATTDAPEEIAAATTAAAPADTAAPVAPVDGVDDSSTGGSSSTLILVIAGVVAVAAAAFMLLRSRSSGGA